MKKRHIWFLINGMLIIALFLTACGGVEEVVEEGAEEVRVGETAVSVSEEEAETEAVVEEPAADAVPLTIWADPIRAEVISAAVADFEADFGVDVVVRESNLYDILNNYQVAAPAGEGPDIIMGAHDWLGELVTNGLLAPIDLGEQEAAFTTAALQAFQYDNDLYGLPFSTENVALFRNVDLVPDAPATWDEVVAVSRELTAINDDNIETNQYGFVLAGNDAYHFFPMMTAYGGYVFGQNEDGTYNPSDIGIGSAGAIEGAALYDAMMEEGLIPSSVDGQMIVDWFEQGKAALIITGPWNLVRIRESGINYAIDPLPDGSENGRPFLGALGFSINALSENQLLAQIFLNEFLSTPELMQALYDADPRTPAYLPVLDTINDADTVAFAAAGENALPMPAIPEMGSVWQAWGNALTLVSQQTEEPEAAFTTAAEQIAAAISGEPVTEAATGSENTEPVVYDMVNIPGTLQTAIGCSGDWQPDCPESALTLGDDGLWSGTFDIPVGDYEVKIAANGGWDINFGVDGEHNGANIALSVPAATSVTFAFDPATNLLSITGEGIEVTGGAAFGDG